MKLSWCRLIAEQLGLLKHQTTNIFSLWTVLSIPVQLASYPTLNCADLWSKVPLCVMLPSVDTQRWWTLWLLLESTSMPKMWAKLSGILRPLIRVSLVICCPLRKDWQRIVRTDFSIRLFHSILDLLCHKLDWKGWETNHLSIMARILQQGLVPAYSCEWYWVCVSCVFS